MSSVGPGGPAGAELTYELVMARLESKGCSQLDEAGEFNALRKTSIVMARLERAISPREMTARPFPTR